MTEPIGSGSQFVLIGLKEVYEAVLRIDGKVTAFNEQLLNLKEDFIELKKDQEKDHADHESRIRSLEARQWPLPTVAILLSVGAVITTVILKFI
jgi:hypothetical protein